MNRPFFTTISLSLSLFLLPALLNAEAVQQSFLPARPPPATTIPAFPEQSDASGCALDLPTDLFHSVKSACTGKHSLRRSTCCPVLAAWLYSAYSATALGKTIKRPQQTASYYDLPLLPNDSETCIDTVENRLRSNGIELLRLNDTCDVVYCECGIRLHQLTCREAFSIDSVGGDLIGNHVVNKLENDCLAVNGFSGLDGCSKCLKTLHLLNKGNRSISSEERSSKMHKEDCELMGLTWLLAKNRSAYIRTVSDVLRAKMMSQDGMPDSCTLNSDGMPLAVDSSEINGSPSTTVFHHSSLVGILFLLVHVYIHQILYYCH